MAFAPIRTERLIIRAPEPGDVASTFARRSHPEVARYQDWEMPYSWERAEHAVARSIQIAAAWPDEHGTWNATVVDGANPERILGDLAVSLRWEGRVGFFGYSFHPDHWGQGYATEASWALVNYYFDELGILRIESSLDPVNVPSARVLETCGLLFEGHTIGSFWVGEERSDDMLYGATREEWLRWRDRPRHAPARIALVELGPEAGRAIGMLRTHKSQERFAAPVGELFREALASTAGRPLTLRGIEADGEIVGAVLLGEAGGRHPDALLDTLLIDRLHQRRGIGSATLGLIEAEVRGQGAAGIALSWREGPGSPERFFRERGYEPQAKAADDQVGALKRLF